MRRGSIGILVFLIVALLIAFLAMKQIQNPKSLTDRAAEAAGEAAGRVASAVNEAIQESGLMETIQGIVNQAGGVG
jgi:predicted lipid-binding transport protein (Tim44 family)